MGATPSDSGPHWDSAPELELGLFQQKQRQLHLHQPNVTLRAGVHALPPSVSDAGAGAGAGCDGAAGAGSAPSGVAADEREQ